MKLYCFPSSPNSRKVQALALHLKVPLEIEVVEIRFPIRGGQNPGGNCNQPERIDRDGHLRGPGGNPLVHSHRPGNVTAGFLQSVGQNGRNVLERHTGQKASQKSVAFLHQLEFFVHVDGRVFGKEMARFELQQCRGDQQELAGDLHIQFSHVVEECEVLRDEVDEAQLGDLNLATGDELQQQVQRPLEDGSSYLIGHERRLVAVDLWY